VPAFFRAGSAHGISPFGAFSSRKVSTRFRGDEPTRRLSRRYSRRRSARAGPTSRGLWALTLPGVPRVRRRVSAAAAGCSLGLRPLRVCRLGLGTGLHPCSSRALSGTDLTAETRGAPESQSASAWPVRHRRTDVGRTTLTGFSHRINPATFEQSPVRAIGSPRVALCITVNCQRS
jgi:hypothetical protein